jgi:hypothetical protein
MCSTVHLLVENCSLMRLRNYAKRVMKRTVCADIPRYAQISEQLLYRLDANFGTRPARYSASLKSEPPIGVGWRTNDLGRPSPCAVVRVFFRQVVHRTSSRAKLLGLVMLSLWKYSFICGEKGTCLLAARLRYKTCSLQVCGRSSYRDILLRGG